MNEIKDIAKRLSELSDDMLLDMGRQTFFILNAYYENDLENCHVYEAEIVYVDKLIDNNFTEGEVKTEKLLLNKRGTVLGFLRNVFYENGRTYAQLENYSSYFGNGANEYLQYSRFDLPIEEIIFDPKEVQPMMIFETLIPEKDMLGNDVLDEADKPCFTLKEYSIMPRNKVEEFKKNFFAKLQETGQFDERTMYRARKVTSEEYLKSKKVKEQELN